MYLTTQADFIFSYNGDGTAADYSILVRRRYPEACLAGAFLALKNKEKYPSNYTYFDTFHMFGCNGVVRELLSGLLNNLKDPLQKHVNQAK